MKTTSIVKAAAAALAIALSPAGCQADRISDCPAKATLTNGTSCSDEGLQCPYDIVRTACDGTTSTVPSSCLCQGGTWSCPDSWQCTADGGDDAGANASTD
jgi:hypothetical protein